MTARRPHLRALAAAAALAAGCAGPRDPDAGAVQLQVAFDGRSGAVASVVAELLDPHAGSYLPPRLVTLQRELGGRWGGLLRPVPPGRLVLSARAFDADGARQFHGLAGVDVTGGETALLQVTLEPEQPTQTGAPVVQALTAGATSVGPRRQVSLAAVVTDRDPDAATRLRYRWWASAGTFLGPTDQIRATWQAPPQDTPSVTVALDILDPQRAATVQTLTLRASDDADHLDSLVEVNAWPVLDAVTASVLVVPVGGYAVLQATAHDPDGDELQYAWSTDQCPGIFLGPVDQAQTTFQMGAIPATATCAVTVAVSDGRGGNPQFKLYLAAGPPETLPLPVIDRATATARSAYSGAPVTFSVSAHDPKQPAAPISFAWSGRHGTIQSVTTVGHASTAVFGSPPCSGDASATVTVTDGASGRSLDYRFDLDTCPASCRELKEQAPALGDGVYLIAPRSVTEAVQAPLGAYCDMTTDGGGWTYVGHLDGAAVRRDLFEVAAGYQSSRGAGRSYGLGVLPLLQDNEMMITLDTPDPAEAAAAESLVFFEYPSLHPSFNWGPLPCTSVQTFGFRTAPGGPYLASDAWSCTADAWAPRDPARQLDLIRLGGMGVFSGGALRRSGLDRGWGHEAWIYVR
jgi:hypothetical protein